MRQSKPLISVVVCSYNGVSTLAGCLKAIKKQKWNGKLEVIVVDDGSKDDTYKIAKSFRGIKVIKNERNLGLACSRNVGIKAANGKIIVFTDDDCRPSPTWIKNLYTGYTSDEVLGVGGPLSSNDKQNLVLRYLHFKNPMKPLEHKLLKSNSIAYRFGLYLKDLIGLSKPVPNRKRVVYSVAGGNMSFRKSTLEQIGMFDEKFTFGSEDQELCLRINKIFPNSLYFVPKAKSSHQFDSRLRDTLRRSRAYGIGNARLSRKHREVTATVFPFPEVIILSFLLGLINPWLLLTPFVLTLAVYSDGIRQALKRRSLEPLLYSYIQFLQELYNNIGFVKGWWKFRRTFDKQKKLSSVAISKSKKVKYVSPKDDAKRNSHFLINRTKHELGDKLERNNKFRIEASIAGSILGVILLSTLLKSSTILHVPMAITLILISGYMLLRGLKIEARDRLPGMLRVAMTTVLGVVWLMLFGLLADVILPLLNVSHPLTYSWLPLIFTGVTALLIPWSFRYKIAARKVSNFKFNIDTAVFSLLMILTLFFSFGGARMLNNGQSNTLAIAAFISGTLSIAYVVLRQKYLPKVTYPIALFVISLASVWSYSLRSNYVFGWDIQQEFHVFQATLSSGTWALGGTHSAYGALLSLSIFPVVVSKIAGVAGLTIFKFISPILFSFVPVVLYYLYRLFTKRWLAFLSALVIVAQFYYMQQFAAEVRQQIAFLFFASILYLIFQNKLKRSTKNILLGTFIVGLVVSHYSTTYLAIAFLGGTYLFSKLIFALLKISKRNKTAIKDKYIQGWMIASLIVMAVVWYGPATHSTTYLSKVDSKHQISKLFSDIDNDINKKSATTVYDPKSTEAFLQSIGVQYHKEYSEFSYYGGNTNSQISPVLQPEVSKKNTALKTLSNAVNIVLSYGWWILGGAGILVIALAAVRKLEYRRLELAVLGSLGVIAFLVIHLLPSLQNAYNASRLNEQVLMIVSLPSLLILAWILHRLPMRYIRLTLTTLLVASFLIASGLITQMVGAKPSDANLNDYGVDYNNLYVHQTDIAAAEWLGTQYNSSSTVYADSYSTLKLTSTNTITHGQIAVVTPDTIAQYSYVYGDYTNIRSGLATSIVGGNDYTYSFPSSFLEQNKNLVYTNGSAEVYK
jgi:uncharacterized membrane protein/GT2 family glycosyltransferase